MNRGIDYFKAMFIMRLAVPLVVSLIYCFMLYPIPSIIVSIVAITLYIVLSNISKKNSIDNDRTLRRKAALRVAQAFLSRYDDIWKNLRLSNNYCSLSLSADGKTIVGIEKPNGLDSYKTFQVVGSKIYSVEEVWNMFCKNFCYNTTYDELKEDCYLYKLIIKETILTNNVKKQLPPEITVTPTKLIDINNCSEDELTNLPGISKIMAKKVVKRRSEIHGFKSNEEFFDYIKLSSSIQENLKNMIVVKEIQIEKGPEIFEERNLDL